MAAIRIAREKDLAEKSRLLADENYRNAETQRLRAETAQREAEANLQTAEKERRRAETAQHEALANLQTAENERRRAEVNFTKARDAVDQMLTRVGQERLSGVPKMEPVRRALLEEALRFYQGFLVEKSDDATLRQETARASGCVATICETLGQFKDAREMYTLSRPALP